MREGNVWQGEEGKELQQEVLLEKMKRKVRNNRRVSAIGLDEDEEVCAGRGGMG